MTSVEKMLELAARVEAATADEQPMLLKEAADLIFSDDEEARCKTARFIFIEAFESAAMALLPEGWGYSICPKSTLLTRGPVSGRQEQVMARGAIPALAVTAAALRARAASEPGQ